MATGIGADQGKSSFVEEVLSRDPKANESSVNEEWTKSGHDGKISGSLVSKIRANLGLTRAKSPSPKLTRPDSAATKKRGRPPGSTNKTKSEPAPSNGLPAASPARAPRVAARPAHSHLDLEGEFDHLIYKLIAVGGLDEVADALRRARRLLIHSGSRD